MNNVHGSSKPRAVVYVRVSTSAQADEGNSLVSQERICREFAVRKGFDVIHVFVEAGESAKTANRTQLQEMLKFCTIRKNNISAVLVYKVDRLARSTEDHATIRALLKRYKIELLSATEQFDDTAAGKFIENTLANVAQFDNDMRSERCGGGMKDAVREGRYVWPAPVGFRNGVVGGKPNLELGDMSALVLQSFETVATSLHPIDGVWKMMSDRGLCLKNGKSPARSYFYKMLTNKVYMGVIEKFGETNKGSFEPIVSVELFNQVQCVLLKKGKKSSVYKRDNPDFPLRRFIENSEGKKLTGSFAKGKYPYYRFVGVKKSDMRSEIVHQDFADFMNRFAPSKEHLNKLESLVRKKFAEATKGQQKALEEIEVRLTGLQDRQAVLIDKNLSGVVSDDVLKSQLARMEKETFALYEKQVSLKHGRVDVAGALTLARDYISAPGKVWLQARHETKTKLQKFQFPSGVVFDGKEFKTSETSFIFATESVFSTELSTGVDRTGFEPATLSLQMRCSTN